MCVEIHFWSSWEVRGQLNSDPISSNYKRAESVFALSFPFFSTSSSSLSDHEMQRRGKKTNQQNICHLTTCLRAACCLLDSLFCTVKKKGWQFKKKTSCTVVQVFKSLASQKNTCKIKASLTSSSKIQL